MCSYARSPQILRIMNYSPQGGKYYREFLGDFPTQMIDLSEKQHVGVRNSPTRPSSTLVLDNGVFELKAGYKDDLSMVVRNRIYRNKDRVSFDPYAFASLKSMFDGDVVINMDVFEHTLDMVLQHLKPVSLDNLIMTITPHMPTEAELLEMLFSVYRFNKVQLGFDFMYAYNKRFGCADGLVVAVKYSSVIVAYVSEGRIADIYKLCFGGKDLIEYANYIMVDKYKEFRKDYTNLIDYVRVPDDYDREAVRIYAEMSSGEYQNNLFLTDPVELKGERTAKKCKRAAQQAIAMPQVDGQLLDTPDSKLSAAQIKEKKRQKMLYCGTMYRYKVKIEKAVQMLGEVLESQREELEKQNDLGAYLAKKKARFHRLKRELELRDKLRQDVRNRKTQEFRIKNKEGCLSPEEQRIRDSIADAEDEEQELSITQKIDRLSADILKLDPDFIPFYANTVEILRGDNIGRQCANIELIKWPEVFFEPSIIGCEQMGLAEILEQVSAKYCIDKVLICGGFSRIKNMVSRIESILRMHSTDRKATIVLSETPQTDAFYGADFIPACPTYTREEFLKYGAEELVKMHKKC